MPDYALDDAALLARCRVDRFCASGPGGQHVNKTSSAVRLVHPAGVEAQCQDERDRLRNQALALHRLRLRLALVERGGSDAAWVATRRQGRRLPVGPNAAGYHLVVACCLDALAAAEGSLAAAATSLGVSIS